MIRLEQLLRKLTDAQKLKGTNSMIETARALDNHLDGAWQEFDELADLKHDYEAIERENEELRRRLRSAGLSDKIEESVVAA